MQSTLSITLLIDSLRPGVRENVLRCDTENNSSSCLSFGCLWCNTENELLLELDAAGGVC
jgi:hypothetical protein